MRVGIVALQHESNTFLARPTAFADFESDLLLRGGAARKLESSHHEVGGFFAGLAEASIEAVPVFAARAIPSGTISSEAFHQLRTMLQEELDRAGPLDGLLVAPHGAAVAEDHPDADGHWLAELRARFGPRFPIIGTLDPHGNLSPLMVASTSALVSYRTNPHLDQRERGIEAATIMARTLRGEIRPTQAAAFPPLIINIERQRTDEPHLRKQYEYAEEMQKLPGVLSTSLMMGFPYADVAEMGSAVIVVTDGDASLAEEFAGMLGRLMWGRRSLYVGQLIDVPTAVEFAATHDGPICLLDMGDNLGGGSPGDGTILAHALHERRIGPAFVCIHDPETAASAWRDGVGSLRGFRIGGKTDALHGSPLAMPCTVERVLDGRFDEPQARHGGFQSFDMGPTAILRAETGLAVMVTSRRVPPFSLRQLTAAGLDPESFRVLVAKGVHAPVAAYAPVCKHLLRVNTPGLTTADLSQLPFRHRRRPMFPFEMDTTWP